MRRRSRLLSSPHGRLPLYSIARTDHHQSIPHQQPVDHVWHFLIPYPPLTGFLHRVFLCANNSSTSIENINAVWASPDSLSTYYSTQDYKMQSGNAANVERYPLGHSKHDINQIVFSIADWKEETRWFGQPTIIISQSTPSHFHPSHSTEHAALQSIGTTLHSDSHHFKLHSFSSEICKTAVVDDYLSMANPKKAASIHSFFRKW